MAQNSSKTDISSYTPLVDEEMVKKYTYNERLKVGKIVRQIVHKRAYGIAIMAQQTKKVNELQAELVALGFPAVDLIQPDFDDPEKLEEYIKLSAYQG